MPEVIEPSMTPVPGAPVEAAPGEPPRETEPEAEAPTLVELVFILGMLAVFIAGFVLLYQPLVMRMITQMGALFGQPSAP